MKLDKKVVKHSKKKFVQYSTVAPDPFANQTPQFKFLAEYLRTGDIYHSGRRYWPEKTETMLVKFTGTRKAQQTLKFIADMRERGLILSDNALENAAGAVAFSDVANIFEADGLTVKNINDIDVMTRYGIKSFKVIKSMQGEIYDIVMHDKLKALDMLFKRYNKFEANNKAKAPKVVVSLGDGREIQNG
jgi:hypothetical protein